MPFCGPELTVQRCGPELWRLVDCVDYQGARDLLSVPAGFVTDFASVPRWITWLIPRYGVYTAAAVLHDHLCVEAHAGRFSRADADGLFRRVLGELGVPGPRRWLMWTAVRAASRMSDASRQDWWRFLLIAPPAVVFLAPPVLLVWLWTLIFNALEWGRS